MRNSKILERQQLRTCVEEWRRAGEGRPITPAEERAEIVAALGDVDAVIIFPELDVRGLIREIRPDIQAKGTDYTAESVPERDVVGEYGGGGAGGGGAEKKY